MFLGFLNVPINQENKINWASLGQWLGSVVNTKQKPAQSPRRNKNKYSCVERKHLFRRCGEVWGWVVRPCSIHIYVYRIQPLKNFHSFRGLFGILRGAITASWSVLTVALGPRCFRSLPHCHLPFNGKCWVR